MCRSSAASAQRRDSSSQAASLAWWSGRDSTLAGCSARGSTMVGIVGIRPRAAVLGGQLLDLLLERGQDRLAFLHQRHALAVLLQRGLEAQGLLIEQRDDRLQSRQILV